MDAIKAAFEKQFGTDWSLPVFQGTSDSPAQSDSIREIAKGQNRADAGDEVDDEEQGEVPGIEQKKIVEQNPEPITVKYAEPTHGSTITKAERRKFMSATAPPKDIIVNPSNLPSEEQEDLQNDLVLQRLIEESHILSEQKGYSGADISGAGDPLEMAGKSRLKLMDARLAKAGAKPDRSKSNSHAPQNIVQGIRAKTKERDMKKRSYAKEAGVVLAREKKAPKIRKHTKGLRINSVGRETAYGINVSSLEIARVTRKGKKSKSKSKSNRR